MEEALLEFEKKHIAGHIDTSSAVWTLIQQQTSQSNCDISSNCSKIFC